MRVLQKQAFVYVLEITVLKNFTKFTWKHLSFLKTLHVGHKKETPPQVFVNSGTFLRTSLYRKLRAAVSGARSVIWTAYGQRSKAWTNCMSNTDWISSNFLGAHSLPFKKEKNIRSTNF